MTEVDCSVVILNWNKRDLLLRSLEALHRAPPSRYRLEIIVVDNGSTDGSAEAVRRRFPGVQLLANARNLGSAQGRNVGLRAARGEFALLLDDDTTIYPRQLDALMGIAKTHRDAGIVTCMKVDADGNALYQYHVPLPSTLGLAFFVVTELALGEIARAVKRVLRWGEAVPHRSKELVEIPYIGGAILLARGEAIRDVGLFDGNIFFFAEDFDWCYRFRRRGWKILYVPTVRVISGHGINATRTRRASLAALRARRYLFAKHVGERYLPVYVIVAVLGLIPKITFYVAQGLRRRGAGDLSLREWFRGALRCIADRPTAQAPAAMEWGRDR